MHDSGRILRGAAEVIAAVNSGETPAEIKLGSGKKITLPRLGVAIEYY